MTPPPLLSELTCRLVPHGLSVRGVLYPHGMGTLALIGNMGRALWPRFQAGRRSEPDPLDAWTRRVIDPVAQELGAAALYPFEGPPWHPFQSWAREAEGLEPSPVGPLMHPQVGLWHAYRAALVFPERWEAPPRQTHPHPCDTCTDKPCLSACPVSAFGAGGYDVPACMKEVRGADRGGCRALGCAARRACPVGRDHTYVPEELAFHMDAFLRML